MTLMRIRLELARTEDFPNGSSEHGYEFFAPIGNDGKIDRDAWRSLKDQCRVTRFWGSEETQVGLLRHVGSGWRFDYNNAETTDDEPFFKLDRHSIMPGAYVSVTEQDGVQRPFRIVSVVPVVQPFTTTPSV